MPSVFNNQAVLEFKFKFDILKVCFKISFFFNSIYKSQYMQDNNNGCLTRFIQLILQMTLSYNSKT